MTPQIDCKVATLYNIHLVQEQLYLLEERAAILLRLFSECSPEPLKNLELRRTVDTLKVLSEYVEEGMRLVLRVLPTLEADTEVTDAVLGVMESSERLRSRMASVKEEQILGSPWIDQQLGYKSTYEQCDHVFTCMRQCRANSHTMLLLYGMGSSREDLDEACALVLSALLSYGEDQVQESNEDAQTSS